MKNSNPGKIICIIFLIATTRMVFAATEHDAPLDYSNILPAARKEIKSAAELYRKTLLSIAACRDLSNDTGVDTSWFEFLDEIAGQIDQSVEFSRALSEAQLSDLINPADEELDEWGGLLQSLNSYAAMGDEIMLNLTNYWQETAAILPYSHNNLNKAVVAIMGDLQLSNQAFDQARSLYESALEKHRMLVIERMAADSIWWSRVQIGLGTAVMLAIPIIYYYMVRHRGITVPVTVMAAPVTMKPIIDRTAFIEAFREAKNGGFGATMQNILETVKLSPRIYNNCN